MAEEKPKFSEKEFDLVYDSLDSEGTGKLTLKDVKEKFLAKALQRLGNNPTDTEIEQYFKDMDTNRDGFVSKDEFREWNLNFIAAYNNPEKSLQMAVKVMFRACDLNEDGRISKDEFRQFMNKYKRVFSDKEIDVLFVIVDKDGDTSTLNQEELLTILRVGQFLKNKNSLKS